MVLRRQPPPVEETGNWVFDLIGIADTEEFFKDVLYPTTFIVLVGWASLFLVPTTKYPRTTVLIPALIISVGYLGALLYGMKHGLTSVEDFKSLEGMAGNLSNIEVALASFYHVAVMDLLVAHAMALDFYSNYEVKTFHRLVFTLCLFLTFAAGPVGFAFYWVVRSTIMKKHRLFKPEEWYKPKTHWQVLQEDLGDAIPTPHTYIDQYMPQGLRKPTYYFFGVVGLVCMLLMLVIYIPYVIFCILYFSVTRPLSIFKGFEGVAGKRFPFRSLIVVGAHGRLFWTMNQQFLIVKLLFGWWLPIILQFAFFLEYIPVGRSVVLYIDVLVEEFGPQFPFGNGIGFSTHAGVKKLIEDPNVSKGPNSLGWQVSKAQYIFSNKTLVYYPQIKQQRFIVKQGRQIARAFLQDIVKNLHKPLTQAKLDASTAFPNDDGSMVDKKVIEKSFMSTFFHLLTGGEFTRKEMDMLDNVLYNPGPFLPSWFNFLMFGGSLERKAVAGYTMVRNAILRYPRAPALQRALALGDSFGWNPPETVRYVSIIFAIAGAVAPSELCSETVKRLYEDRSRLPLYEKNPRNFIKETARLHNQVPLVTVEAYYELERTVIIKGKNYIIPTGTTLHASIVNANRDPDVFGHEARTFYGDRNPEVVSQLLTWNGTDATIEASKGGDSPPRRCPGHNPALCVVKWVVDRFKPPGERETQDMLKISNDRYNDINTRELTSFVRFQLFMSKNYQQMWNTNFPLAADALYPGDAVQKDLGQGTLPFGYTLPIYDEDEPPTPLVPIIQYTLKLGGPPQDYSGEFRSSDEAVGWRVRWFGKLFPPANIEYLDIPNPDDQASHLAFAGAACLRTTPVDSYDPDAPAGAAFVNDNTFLRKYNVRLGYQRYGAAAYFDRSGDLLGIKTSFDGRIVPNPKRFKWPWEESDGLKQWNHAVWAWKTSALALATVNDHLGKTHLIESNALVYCTRKHLKPTHPLRAFFKIFTYRTISINFNASSVLTIRRGHVERIWAFESDDLQQLFVDITNNYEFNLLPDLIHPGMKSLEDRTYPANHDLPGFWKILRTLVHSVFTAVYVHGPQTLDDDAEMQACLKELEGKLNLDKNENIDLDDFDDVVDVFTSLICSVTAYHEHVGQVSDYFGSPYVVGTTLREGKEQDSIQTYAQLLSLVCSTGLRVPRLLDNWEHLLQRDVFATQTVKAFRNCQADLEKLSVEIERRNDKTRKFPMMGFNPRRMESSVSV